MGFWILFLSVWVAAADSYPKFVLRGKNYERIPYGSLKNPCDGKLPIRDGKVLLYDASQTDFSLVGKALEGSFYLWREYPCKDGKVHGVAQEYQSGKVVEAVPYEDGEVQGKKVVYYPSGQTKEILHFDDGEREGEYRKFDTQGRLMIIAHYDDNQLDGKVRYFDNLRNVVTVFEYDDGRVEGEPTYETSNVQEALILASRNGHLKQVEQILSKGISGKKATANGYGETEATDDTALIAAIHARHPKVFEKLLALGADPNLPTRKERLSPLMVAVLSGQKEIVSALLAKGANPNWQNGDGDTVLHLAVDQGAIEMVQLLVGGGSRTDVRNKKGVTPSKLGVSKGQAMETALKSATPSEPTGGE